MPTIPAPSPGFLNLMPNNNYTHLKYWVHQRYQKASSVRNVNITHEPAICRDRPESAKVLKQHHKNRTRMLKHRWKKLGLQDLVSSSNRNAHTPEQNAFAVKTDSLLKIKTSQAEAQRGNKETNSLHYSNSSEVGLPEGKVSDKHLSSNISGSECHTDSDSSDQEQESIEMSEWASALEFNLKPEPFDKDLDLHSTETAFYPEVLPASLKVLDSTQSLFVTDPCLAAIIARLMELDRLQAATVQKERAKLVRSRPTTANARNGNRLRKSDFPGCKTGISRDAECNSVICSFAKLMVCPNSSCRCRHHTCPLTKSGQGSRSKLSHPTLLKRPDSMSGKCTKAETFSVSVKFPQKPTVPNRTKSPKTQRGSTSTKKATVPNRKT